MNFKKWSFLTNPRGGVYITITFSRGVHLSCSNFRVGHIFVAEGCKIYGPTSGVFDTLPKLVFTSKCSHHYTRHSTFSHYMWSYLFNEFNYFVTECIFGWQTAIRNWMALFNWRRLFIGLFLKFIDGVGYYIIVIYVKRKYIYYY